MTRIIGLHPAVPAIAMALLLSACGTTGPIRSASVPAAAQEQPEPEPAPALSPRMAAAADTLTKMAALQDRLYRVAAPLLINNAELCKSHARNLLGFTAKNRYSYPGEFNEAAQAAMGMGDRLQVTGVLAGSGAARAGLRRGDGLIAAGGKPLPVGSNASTLAGAVFGPLVNSHANIDMKVERDDKVHLLTVPVTRACGFGVELGNADNVNAYADGQRVMITRGMINFTQNDDELAYLMANGIAHNVLGHAATQRNANTIGSIIDNLMGMHPDTSMLIGSGGIRAMPQELDAAADTLSLYMLARAGYNIDGANAFWKRLAAAHPATVLNGYVANHPGTAHRLAAIDKTVAEIKAKQAARKPLTP